MVKATVAVPWQVLQVEATKAWVACVMFIGPNVPTAYVVVLWQELQSVLPVVVRLLDSATTTA